MDIISIILLGLTQGITEWVPVSSKTQDTLVYLKLLGGDEASVVPVLLYLHIGTLFAAAIYFRKELLALASSLLKEPTNTKKHSNSELGFLFTSLLLTGLIGVPLLLIEKEFLPGLGWGALLVVMGAGLFVTGILLLYQKGEKKRRAEEASWKDGILTGILQGLSVLPGISRAGTSTTALIWRGFDSESSFRLSFLLSIPTVIFAELVLYIGGGIGSFPISDGLLLSASSFIFGYLTLDALLKLARKVNLAYVAFALGLVMVLAGLLGAG